eukprot:COSAG01_NODE_28132_length_668_cov_1.001757_3_plen_30_part_01
MICCHGSDVKAAQQILGGGKEDGKLDKHGL